MNTTREPYEFMVRWIPAGLPENQYAGTVQAQINFAYVVRDGDVVTSWTPDSKGPFHVALTGDDGIALGAILPDLNAAILADLHQLQAAKLAVESDLVAAQTSITQLNEHVAQLNNRIVELTPPPTPEFPPVSRMQAILALHDVGLLDQVNAIVAAADVRTRLAWETATDFHRSSPTIAALWRALGRTEEQLDALFVAAKRIEV